MNSRLRSARHPPATNESAEEPLADADGPMATALALNVRSQAI